MSRKVFVDTNVFLDVIFSRHQPSAQFFRAAQEESVGLCVSLKTVMDFDYFVKGSFPKEQLKSMLNDLVTLHQLLPTTKQNVVDALSSKFSDFEDAVQHFTALAEPGMEAIITRNKRDYRHSRLPVYTPDEFVRMMKEL